MTVTPLPLLPDPARLAAERKEERLAGKLQRRFSQLHAVAPGARLPQMYCARCHCALNACAGPRLALRSPDDSLRRKNPRIGQLLMCLIEVT